MKEKLKKELNFKNIIHWLLGLFGCGLGISLCTKAGLGLSMIAAPPYILHVWLRDRFPFYTQGMSEYVFEALLLIVMCLIVRRFRLKYLLSFVTAVCSGFAIDLCLMLLGGNGLYVSMPGRIAAFAGGTVITAFGVACFFRTTLPLQVYELTVTEISDRYRFPKDRVKWIFDISMLVLALALSFLLTRKLTGIGVGTVIVTAVNSPIIHLFGKLIDRVEGNAKPEGKAKE